MAFFNSRKPSRGSLLVEAAIILPIVFLLIAIILNGKQMLDNRKEAFSAIHESLQWIAAQKYSTPSMTDATGISNAQNKAQNLLSAECYNCSNITATASIAAFSNPPGGRYINLKLSYDYDIFFFPIYIFESFTFNLDGTGAYD